MNFADMLRERRMALGLTMRRFAQNKGYDVAYISRLENELMPAPGDQEKLKALAHALELKEGTHEWVDFFDSAALSRNEVPQDLKDNPVIPRLLPAFYRTLRKEKITDKEIEKLAKLLKGDNNDKKAKTATTKNKVSKQR